jgi:hypothetical protein
MSRDARRFSGSFILAYANRNRNIARKLGKQELCRGEQTWRAFPG